MVLPIKPLSQRDEKWASKKLGTSTVNTIGSHGCLLTCATMVCNYFGKNTDPARLNDEMVRVKGFYNGSLWVWGKLSEVYPDILFDWDVYNKGHCADVPAPLDLIDSLLAEKIPVIVKVDFNPGGELNEHWVLIVGKDEAGSYLINDPWTGETYFFQSKYQDPARYIFQICAYRGPIPQDKYQLLKGGVVLKEYEFNPEDKISDLEDKISSLNEELAKTRLEVNSLREALETQERDNADLSNQLQQARNERDNAIIQLKEAQKKAEELQRSIDSLSKEKTARENDLVAFHDRIKQLEAEKVENWDKWKLLALALSKFFKK